MIDIKSMGIDDLSDLVIRLGEPAFRAEQLFKWLQSGADSFDEMTNIPKLLAAKLADVSYIAFAKTEKRLVSKIDGTVKYLFRLYDGEFVESVLMKYEPDIRFAYQRRSAVIWVVSFVLPGFSEKPAI